MEAVLAAIQVARKAGVTPTEVWIGPYQAMIFEAEMKAHWEEGRLKDFTKIPLVIGQGPIQPKMEGATLLGLTVRVKNHDGIRVGVSFEA